MDEAAFLAALRALPLHHAACGLADDAAIWGRQVLTLDTLVEGVHFLPDDPPADVAWKLVATNYSDLAAKGAAPVAVMLAYPLSTPSWDAAFLAGIAEALAAHGGAILGGDTVSLPPGAPRVLSLTAIGIADVAPARNGARAGDALWVTGTIGDGGAGLAIAKRLAGDTAGLAVARTGAGPPELVARYRRPTPRLAEGAALAPLVSAMMDVSDGLLIDTARLAAASGLAAALDLGCVPRSAALVAHEDDVLAAVTAGDDYELLFALHPAVLPPVAATRIGTLVAGSGLTLVHDGAPVPLPASLGFLHGEQPLALTNALP